MRKREMERQWRSMLRERNEMASEASGAHLALTLIESQFSLVEQQHRMLGEEMRRLRKMITDYREERDRHWMRSRT